MNTTMRSLRPAILALLVASASAPLAAQDAQWVETKFNRVYLINGNFIDGQVTKVTDTNVTLRMSAGDMSIKKDMVDRIELIKMRSLKEKPKLDPPLKKASPAEIGSPLQRLKSGATFAPAPATEDMIQNVGAILSRLKVAKPDQKDGLIEQLADLSQVGPYLASILPTVDEESAYMIRNALLRSRDPNANPFLVRALDSDKAYVQLSALNLLGNLGTEDDARSIRPFLSDLYVPAVRAQAIQALQQLKDAAAIPAIAELVGNREDMIRVAAITASLELGLKSDRLDLVMDSIRQALVSSQGKVAKELMGAVTRGKFSALWKEVVPFLNDADPMLRKTAAHTLDTLAVPDCAEAVINRLNQEDDVPTLLELTRVSPKLKTQAVIPPLIHLLGHDSKDVVQGAGAALTYLTREKFGTNKDLWTEWWDRVGK
jgi:HEAT repeat protein